jgi:hypothetical protein
MNRMILNMNENDTIKWAHDGKLHCLHIQRDEFPEDPREWSNLTIMACWHRRYRLGDKIADSSQEDFWRRLVQENVPDSEVYAMAEAGRLNGIRIAQNDEDPELIDVYETTYFRTANGRTVPEECLEHEGVCRDEAVECLLEDLEPNHCMTLMEPYAEWMPLWLYDHSGITMSCGFRTYPYNDRWDSGQVGWIVSLKKTIIAETVEYVLDENGERIREDHKREGHPPTWSYKTRSLNDETWRKRAIEIMESDVKVYDQYLTGDVFGFTLYKSEMPEDGDEPDWNEEDSCFGFYGEDITQNGICDHVGCGIMEAIQTGRYKVGEAELHTRSYYTF